MGTVTNLNEWKRQKQEGKEIDLERQRFEHEQRCHNLFMQQHSDDDVFENDNEFEFSDSDKNPTG